MRTTLAHCTLQRRRRGQQWRLRHSTEILSPVLSRENVRVKRAAAGMCVLFLLPPTPNPSLYSLPPPLPHRTACRNNIQNNKNPDPDPVTTHNTRQKPPHSHSQLSRTHTQVHSRVCRARTHMHAPLSIASNSLALSRARARARTVVSEKRRYGFSLFSH